MTLGKSTPETLDKSDERSSMTPLDALIGMAMAFVAAANLVQGAWTEELPLLNLTTIGFGISSLVGMLTIFKRAALRGALPIVLVGLVLLLGMVPSELNPGSASKRSGLLIGVLLVLVIALLTLTNGSRLRAFLTTILLLAVVVFVAQLIAPDPAFIIDSRRTPIGLNPIGAGRALGAGVVVAITGSSQ